MTTFDKIREIVSEEMGLDPSEVKLASSFRGDLGADSLEIMQIVIALEEAFGCEIPNDDAEKLFTVRDAVEYANTHSSRFEADSHTCTQ